jgi:hypothetical protein
MKHEAQYASAIHTITYAVRCLQFEALSNSDYVVSNSRITVNNVLECTCKEAVVAYF